MTVYKQKQDVWLEPVLFELGKTWQQDALSEAENSEFDHELNTAADLGQLAVGFAENQQLAHYVL